MTSINATNATEADHRSRPLMGDADGFPLNQQLGKRFVTLSASGAPTEKYPIQLLDGTSGILTITFPDDMKNLVGQDITFISIATQRAHVITGKAGWLQGDDSITMPATGGSVTIHVYSPTAAGITGTGGVGTYVIA